MKKLIFILLLGVLPMGLFAKKNPEQIFWKWFQKNESKFFDLEKDKDNLLDKLSKELTKYKDGLTYEVSTVESGKRELIISADGLKEIFPSVEALVTSAPELNRWKVIAFRPRHKDYADFVLNYEEEEFDPSKIWIYYRVEDGFFDLALYHPAYDEKERNLYVSASYILLDTALGEYDVTMNVRYIDHRKLPKNPQEEGLTPFSKLSEKFDKYKKIHRSNL